jgi:hypothetical protein
VCTSKKAMKFSKVKVGVQEIGVQEVGVLEGPRFREKLTIDVLVRPLHNFIHCFTWS